MTESSIMTSDSIMTSHSIIAGKYPVVSLEDHAKNRDMWLGSRQICEFNDYVLIDNKFVKALIKYSPAMLQCVMELLTNVSDHKYRNPSTVTQMYITYKDKILTIKNNGPGFDLDIHPKLVDQKTGRAIYIPEMLLARFLSGTNFDFSGTNKNIETVSGGTNGLGLKLINVNAMEMSVETVGRNIQGKKFKYNQSFRNRLDIIEEPKIQSVADSTEEYTIITFNPCYDALGGYNEDIEVLIRTRVHIMAAWFGNTVDVRYNNIKININNIGHLAELVTQVTPGDVTRTAVTCGKYNWELAVIVKKDCADRLSLVNGIIVPKGDHIRRITKNIVDKSSVIVREFCEKSKYKYQVGNIKNNISIFMKCLVGNPNWKSQTKDELSLPVVLKISSLSADFIKSIADKVCVIIKQLMLEENNEIKKEDKKDKKKNTSSIYYETCEWAGTNKYQQCQCFITEGSSASLMVRTGLGDIKCKVKTGGSNSNGIFSLRGVPPNAIKNFKDKCTNTKDIKNYTTVFSENLVIVALLNSLGLDINKTYLNISDRNSGLRYGKNSNYHR